MENFKDFLTSFLREAQHQYGRITSDGTDYFFRVTDDGTGLVQCDSDGKQISGGIEILKDRDGLTPAFLGGDRRQKFAIIKTRYVNFEAGNH